MIFGPKKLPDLGRSIGGGMREFKNSITGDDREDLPPGDPASATKPSPPAFSLARIKPIDHGDQLTLVDHLTSCALA